MERYSNADASGVDVLAFDFRGKRLFLEPLQYRAYLHLSVRNRIKFPVRVKNAAYFITGHKRRGKPCLLQSNEAVVSVSMRLHRVNKLLRVPPTPETNRVILWGEP